MNQHDPAGTSIAASNSDPIFTKAIMIASLALAIALAGIGAVWLNETMGRTGAQQASIAGLFLKIEATRWLKAQMDHGKVIAMPKSMMPDLPDQGYQRLSVELVIYNRGNSPQTFRARELFLCQTENKNWPAAPSSISEIVLSPGQLTNFYLQFDVPHEMTDALHLEWQRHGIKRRLTSVPRPAHPPMDHSMAMAGNSGIAGSFRSQIREDRRLGLAEPTPRIS